MSREHTLSERVTLRPQQPRLTGPWGLTAASTASFAFRLLSMTLWRLPLLCSITRQRNRDETCRRARRLSLGPAEPTPPPGTAQSPFFRRRGACFQRLGRDALLPLRPGLLNSRQGPSGNPMGSGQPPASTGQEVGAIRKGSRGAKVQAPVACSASGHGGVSWGDSGAEAWPPAQPLLAA